MSRRQRETVFQQFERWGFDQRGWSQLTRTKYVGRIRSADAWLVEHRGVSVAWARPKDLEAYLFSTSRTAGNRNNVRQALQAFGAFLMDQGWVETNNASGLPRLPTPPWTPKALTLAECRRITAYARTLRATDRGLILAMLFGGLRRSEARLLEWRMVGEDWLRFAGKGSKVREVPMHPELRAALNALHALGLDARWCFPSSRGNGRPVSDTYVWQLVHDVGQQVGIRALHPHALRHSVATRLVERGVGLREVQEYLGHADLGTTQRYVKIRPAGLQDAVTRLDFGVGP